MGQGGGGALEAIPTKAGSTLDDGDGDVVAPVTAAERHVISEHIYLGGGVIAYNASSRLNKTEAYLST